MSPGAQRTTARCTRFSADTPLNDEIARSGATLISIPMATYQPMPRGDYEQPRTIVPIYMLGRALPTVAASSKRAIMD
jgi:hypothetical protein